ncbi:MAG TPA: cysteine desulfurase [Clostridiales bacterium]|nr:cysteine desulfurase [Clostridiales bacterium]
MIYFDNAATGGFKPDKTTDAAVKAMKYLNANAGRSGHRLSAEASFAVYSVRKKLAAFFNAESVERVVFTDNCTAALNTAIFGIYREGAEIVTTVTEHNSVLRPLYKLAREGKISLTVVKPAGKAVTKDDVAPYITEKTAAVVLNAVSNVTGRENDFRSIGAFLKDKNVAFIVDGAQAAGHIPIDMRADGIDVLCAAGHKGLLSLQGAGVLVFGRKTDIRPLLFGGTGTETFNEDMPDDYPERLEAGTLSLPAILSLGGGIDYLSENFPYVSESLKSLSYYLCSALAGKKYLKIYSEPNPCGIISFSHADVPSQELAETLSEKYDVCARGGFHCAPLMHRFLGTEKSGLLRISLSPKNTRREINFLANALEEITHGI